MYVKMARSNEEPEPSELKYLNANGTSDEGHLYYDILAKYDKCCRFVNRRYKRPTRCCVKKCNDDDLVGAHVTLSLGGKQKIVPLCRKHNDTKEMMNLRVETLLFTIDEVRRGKVCLKRIGELKKRLKTSN
jgi:hypothetical protein